MEKPIVQAALKSALIKEENVECRPEKVSNTVTVMDENVDIHLRRKESAQ